MTDTHPTVSVLMPIHVGVRPEYLDQALTSLAVQSRPADELVVVIDGPITSEHESVLSRFPDAVVVRSPQQRGAGHALAAGLAACTGTFVARADSDDINEPQRLARQLDLLHTSGADVCSAAMTEFEGDPARVVGTRSSAAVHAEFARLMRGRNPVNHPAVVFRRRAAESAGGYQELLFLEDYDLWARMLRDGSRFVGDTQALVRFRVDGMHGRRTSRSLDRAELQLQRRLRSYGTVSTGRMWLNVVLRGAYRRLPRPVLERVYALLFRRVGRAGGQPRPWPLRWGRPRGEPYAGQVARPCCRWRTDD